jgi:hypothetical protein
MEEAEEHRMGTIDQPKPSAPKSPQPDTPPLQPGETVTSRSNAADPQRANYQTPDSQHEKFRDEER